METAYLQVALDIELRKEAIKLAKKHLRKIKDEFDFIACTGVSGLLMAPAIADAIGKPFCVIRKEGDNTHSSYNIEGHIKNKQRYIIVDDFMESGATIQKIRDSISGYLRYKQKSDDAIFCGCWFYRPNRPQERMHNINIGTYRVDCNKFSCVQNILNRIVWIRENQPEPKPS